MPQSEPKQLPDGYWGWDKTEFRAPLPPTEQFGIVNRSPGYDHPPYLLARPCRGGMDVMLLTGYGVRPCLSLALGNYMYVGDSVVPEAWKEPIAKALAEIGRRRPNAVLLFQPTEDVDHTPAIMPAITRAKAVPAYTHVLYHANCYDGFGAAFAAWRALGDDATYLPVNYGLKPPSLFPEARVLICDFSYSREELLAFHGSVEHLWVLDHHKTSQEALDGIPFAKFDLAHSGAWLTWVHFFGQPVPEFIEYLEDRDLWRFNLPDSKGVSQALRAYPFDFKVWNELFDDVERLRREAPIVARLTQQLVANMCDHYTMQSIEGYVVPVANATVFFSEVGDELCRRFPDSPFAAYYLDREHGIRQWGLYSRHGFDTSVVAKVLGGGGHAAASGFQQQIGHAPLEAVDA